MRGNGWKRRFFTFALCIALIAVSFAGLSEGETETPAEAATETHEHSWNLVDTVPPTCTEKGYELYACECGETQKRETEAARGHKWGSGEQFDATCEEEGFMLFVCEVCKESERRDVVPPLGHEWEETAIYEAGCETVGYTEYTCKNCKKTKADNQVLPTGHEWPDEWTVDAEATCTQPGVEKRKCEKCGEVETNIIPAGHKWDENDVCTVCGKSAAACIGDTKYASLQEAVDAVKDGEIIALLVDGACALKENQTIKVDVKTYAGEMPFTVDVSVPKDCALTETEEKGVYTFTALKGYAETGNVMYSSLAEAVAAAQPDGVVNVLADEIGDGIVIDKNLTIDFKGFTYTAKDPGLDKSEGGEPDGAALELKPEIEVELKNGMIKGSGNAKYIIQNNSDKLTLTNMTLNATLNANLKYALSVNRGETVLTGATTVSGGVGQWAIDLWMTEIETQNGENEEYARVTLDKNMSGVVAGYVRIYPGSEVVIEDETKYNCGDKTFKGIDEETGCPYYCIAVVITPTPSPTPTPTPTPTATPTPTPSPSPTPTPTATTSGGGGGGGSGSGTADSSTDAEGDEEAAEEEESFAAQGIVDHSLAMMRSLVDFLSGGLFGN